MTQNFNDAGPQRTFEVIPAGTQVTLHLTVRPGGAGEGGWLKRCKAGNSEALDCELIVAEGPYAKRKLWQLLTVSGTADGHAQAADITRRTLRAILESARGVRPDDKSDAANAARQIENWGDLDGVRFIGVLGIEPAQGQYGPRNTLREVITPERKDWHRVEQVPKQPGGATANAGAKPAMPAAAPAIERPQWAR
jgi:hypothetical protein